MSDGFRFDGVFLFAEFVEVFFGLKGGDAAAAGGDDSLTVLRVADVAGGENAFDAGFAAVVFGYDVVFLVQMQMSFNQIRIGVVSDGNEDAVDGDVRRIVCFDVFQPETGYAERAFRTEDFFDDAVPDNVDFVILGDALLHGGRGQLRGRGHQFAALNRFGKTRKVLNFGRDGQLTADLRSGNQNRFEAGAGRVNACSVSGGARTDDEDF